MIILEKVTTRKISLGIKGNNVKFKKRNFNSDLKFSMAITLQINGL